MFILQLNAQFISNLTTTQALKLLNSKFHTEYLKKNALKNCIQMRHCPIMKILLKSVMD